MDKWVPGLCIIFSAVFASTAYFLWSTNISSASFNESDTITQKDSKEDLSFYTKEFEKTKILIVPGHDKQDYGAEFKNLKEEELNLILAEKINNLLEKESDFEIFLTRNEFGYTELFENYFNTNEIEILNFIFENKKDTKQKIMSGDFEPVRVVEHNKVSENVSFKLYGINKWINENEIDLVIHIHFNDYPRNNRNEIGKYSGFSIYTPSNDLNNFFDSKEFAQEIRKNLKKFFKESNLPVEKDIVIENSELIAVGANNTIDKSASVLIEYGYIYEDIDLDKAAYQTYRSILDFFNN